MSDFIANQCREDETGHYTFLRTEHLRRWLKETDSLTVELHFGIRACHTTETREHTDDEKECPRFSEKEGGWAWGKEIKGYVLTVVVRSRRGPAPHSLSILIPSAHKFRFRRVSDQGWGQVAQNSKSFFISQALKANIPVSATRCGTALSIYELGQVIPLSQNTPIDPTPTLQLTPSLRPPNLILN